MSLWETKDLTNRSLLLAGLSNQEFSTGSPALNGLIRCQLNDIRPKVTILQFASAFFLSLGEANARDAAVHCHQVQLAIAILDQL